MLGYVARAQDLPEPGRDPAQRPHSPDRGLSASLIDIKCILSDTHIARLSFFLSFLKIIFLKYLLPFFHFQSLCVSGSKMGLVLGT